MASRASAAIADAVAVAAAALGLLGLEASRAARCERLLSSAVVGSSAREVSATLVLGPDSAAWGRSIAGDPWWRRAVRDVAGGGASAAAEAGWAGAHSLPLQAPEAVASVVASAALSAAGRAEQDGQVNLEARAWRPGQ